LSSPIGSCILVVDVDDDDDDVMVACVVAIVLEGADCNVLDSLELHVDVESDKKVMG
jgi:hypothetical protein